MRLITKSAYIFKLTRKHSIYTQTFLWCDWICYLQNIQTYAHLNLHTNMHKVIFAAMLYVEKLQTFPECVHRWYLICERSHAMFSIIMVYYAPIYFCWRFHTIRLLPPIPLVNCLSLKGSMAITWLFKFCLQKFWR